MAVILKPDHVRDVDLFIGVTSIATDDTWADRGEHRFHAYWRNTGFAPLTGGAQVRRDVLARFRDARTVLAGAHF